MQRDRFEVARVWLRNARHDHDLAQTVVIGFPARATFHAQQAAEMALKGALIAHSDDHPFTRSSGRLVGELAAEGIEVPAEIRADASSLDLYYLVTRYPDAVGDADPIGVVPPEDATRALARAARIIDFCAVSIDRSEQRSHDPIP